MSHVHSVKIYFGDEVRRVGAEHLTQKWDTFVTRLQDLLGRNLGLEVKGQQKYTLQYQDDESDWINMNTTEELEEAFRTPVDVLKIVVNRAVPDSPELPYIQPAPTPTPVVPSPAPTPVVPPSPIPTSTPVPIPEAEPSFGDLNSKAVHLMNQGNFEAARDILLSAIRRFPNIHVFYYNLACVNSLMGSFDEAVENLQEAVSRGYSRLGHMLMDSDLENIRSHPGFKKLAESMANRCSKSPFANLGRLATQVALTIWPENAYVLFNAAKAEAAENPERAAELLAHAVATGMNDPELIMEEPAFQDLLILPAFQAILNGILETPRGDSQSSPAPTPVPQTAAPETEAPQPAVIPSSVPTQCPSPVQVSPPSPTIQRPPPDITTFPSITLPTQTPVPLSQSQSSTPVSSSYSSSIYPPVVAIETPEASEASTPSTPLESVPEVPSFADETPTTEATVDEEERDEEHGVDAGYKYYEQVATLWGMGFFDVPRLRELLEKHNGNVSRVVFDLI